MFGALAALLVVTWHKGALLRAALRARAGSPPAARFAAESTVRPRVDPGSERVRVGADSLSPEEAYARTEVETTAAAARRRRAR